MEEALGDRISFRRFVGLGLQDETPDYSTISRFRTELSKRGLSEELFKELEAQLDKRGLILKEGTLMDATLVEAQVRRPPVSAGRGAKSSTDPDADWSYTGRGSRTHFGYKVHLGVDAGTGLVRKAVLTPAKVYESEVQGNRILTAMILSSPPGIRPESDNFCHLRDLFKRRGLRLSARVTLDRPKCDCPGARWPMFW